MLNFHILNYQAQLQKTINKEIKTKPSELLDRLYGAKIFEFNNSTDIHLFPTKIQKTLTKIAELSIGQDLLTFLIDHPKQKPLHFEFSDRFSFHRYGNTIYINPHGFTIWENEHEKIWHKMPFKVSLVHELIHFKHCLENEKQYIQRISPFNDTSLLLTSDLTDFEEQLTICGIGSQKDSNEIALCENHFRHAWNLPLRFSHAASSSPKRAIQYGTVDPNKFATWFKKYWEKLPSESYRKEALIVDISEPTPNQLALISKIEAYVKVYNLSKVDTETKAILENNERFDTNFSNE